MPILQKQEAEHAQQKNGAAEHLDDEVCEELGNRGFAGSYYPRANPNAARTDAWPPNGLPPGSELSAPRRMGHGFGVLQLLLGAGQQLNHDYAAALASANNEWPIAEWLEPEPRLRSVLVVAYEAPEYALAEIKRFGSHPGFVQVMLTIRTSEPLGRRKYWPMYEAAVEAGAQVISLVSEGVFERFPGLKIVQIEGGFAWVPPLAWRLDSAWRKLREAVPHLRGKPSEVFRRAVLADHAPMEEPPVARQFVEILGQAPWPEDKLMFSTD